MSHTHTTERPAGLAQPQPPAQDQDEVRGQEAASHGRHRGVVRSDDTEAAPSGRHRKPSEHAGPAA